MAEEEEAARPVTALSPEQTAARAEATAAVGVAAALVSARARVALGGPPPPES